MFEIQYEMMVENLNILLEFEITPMNILRDLWAFKYLPSSIRTRLERCQKAEKMDLKPWVIRATEDILTTSLQISQERKTLLGDKGVIEYLAERLGYEPELMKNMIQKNGMVLKVRPAKIKEILDYFLIEEKYEPFHVARCLKVLLHSAETMKKRMDELMSHGCRPTSLAIFCTSQKTYNEFLQKWISERNKREQKMSLESVTSSK